MRRIPRPEVPSIVRGHSRACVNRCRSRARSRDGFRYDPALGAPSLTAPRAPLSRRPWLRCARPPSPRIASIRDFHAERRHALLWVRLPPNDFCNYIPTHGHTHEHPIPACFEAPHYAVAPNAPSPSPLFWRAATFPSRRRITKAASRDNPSDAAPAALQARRKVRHRKPPTSRDAACGRRLDPTTACGDDRWTTALDCTGRVAPSEGPSLPPPAAAVRRGRRFPSSLSYPSTPS